MPSDLKKKKKKSCKRLYWQLSGPPLVSEPGSPDRHRLASLSFSVNPQTAKRPRPEDSRLCLGSMGSSQ